MTRTLRQKLLCTGCAAVLAASLVPLGAWGDDSAEPENPQTALTEVAEDTDTSKDDDTTVETETGVTEAEETPQKEFIVEKDEEAADDQEGKTSSEQPAGAKEKADAENSTTVLANVASLQLTGEIAQATLQLALNTQEVRVNTFKCPFEKCVEKYHFEEEPSVEWSISGSIPDGYTVSLKYDEALDYITLGTESEGSFAPYSFSEPGTHSARVLIAKIDEDGRIVGEPLAEQPLAVHVTEVPYSGIVEPLSNANFLEGDELFFDFLDQFFDFKGQARIVLNRHFDNWISSAKSSNSSVVEITEIAKEADGYTWIDRSASIKGRGNATISITIDGQTYESKATVKGYEDLDASLLRFTTPTLTLSPGFSIWNYDFCDAYISEEGREAVQGHYCVDTSNASVFSYPYPADEQPDGDGGGIRMTAQQPGTVNVNLYFYNPSTGEKTLVDTMKVTVTSQVETIGTSTEDSVYPGHIIPSNDFTNELVRNEELSLKASPLSWEDLSADTSAGLVGVVDASKGEQAILVNLSLVRPDGTVFDNFDEGDPVFTVRLKLDGSLTALHPDSLRVYHLYETGATPMDSWVHDGYLYIVTTHFSPFAIVGRAADDAGNGDGSQGDGSGDTGDQGSGNQGNLTQTGDTGDNKNDDTNTTQKATADKATDKGSKKASRSTELAQTGDAATSTLPFAAFAIFAALLGCFVARRKIAAQR